MNIKFNTTIVFKFIGKVCHKLKSVQDVTIRVKRVLVVQKIDKNISSVSR